MFKIFFLNSISIIIYLNVFTSTNGEKYWSNCQPLVNVNWTHKCSGAVNSALKLKYKDQLTSVGTPYKVMFADSSGASFLATFYDSQMQNCSSIQIGSDMKVKCDENENYHMKKSMVHCFNFYLLYAIELMRVCHDPAEYSVRDFPQGFVALHYAYKPPISAARNLKWKWFLYLTGAIFLV
ncbi:uncharacterized protein LOC105664936 [Ceratitis capitata]|uniref:uncharacterized protein LOC105664936 n=1 Tax=Ceratitis capitata TaxID=7213 RepID=UPI00061882D3|nr:uncharacterized protein LOC105664936 [Ceratitis capitata]